MALRIRKSIQVLHKTNIFKCYSMLERGIKIDDREA